MDSPNTPEKFQKWDQYFSPRAHITPSRPADAPEASVYSARKKVATTYHCNRVRSGKDDTIIESIPRKERLHKEKMKVAKEL